MKKIITIALAFTLLFSSFAVTTFAASSSGEYVKVKKATYQKYKKAYKQNKELKKELKDYIATVSELTMQLEATYDELDAAKLDVEDKQSMNDWLWNCIYGMGLSYKDKTWTVPEEFPQQFRVKGSTYTVKR